MNAIISYQKDVLFAKRFFGYTLAVLGFVMFIITLNAIALILLVIGLGLNIAEGTEIDLTSKTFRTFKSLFGYKYGSWQPLPGFDYISVFKTKENQTIRVVTAETTQTTDIIHLNLFYGNKHITFYKTTDKTQAFEVAEHFKLALEIDVLDATESEKRWL